MTIGTVLVSAALAAPIPFGVNIQYDNVSGFDYDTYPVYKGFYDAIDFIQVIEASLIIITSTLAIAGMMKAIVLRYVLVCKIMGLKHFILAWSILAQPRSDQVCQARRFKIFVIARTG